MESLLLAYNERWTISIGFGAANDDARYVLSPAVLLYGPVGSVRRAAGARALSFPDVLASNIAGPDGWAATVGRLGAATHGPRLHSKVFHAPYRRWQTVTASTDADVNANLAASLTEQIAAMPSGLGAKDLTQVAPVLFNAAERAGLLGAGDPNDALLLACEGPLRVNTLFPAAASAADVELGFLAHLDELAATLNA